MVVFVELKPQRTVVTEYSVERLDCSVQWKYSYYSVDITSYQMGSLPVVMLDLQSTPPHRTIFSTYMYLG